MFLTTKFGFIPVKIVNVERFADETIRSVEVQLPKGSIPETCWVQTRTATGHWIINKSGMTPLSKTGEEPMSPRELEEYIK